jgi:hypothetical protein
MPLRIGWWIDAAAGKASRLLYALRGAEHDTAGDLGPYLDRPHEILFPSPRRVPNARRKRSFSLGLRAVEEVSFASEHENLSEAYAERHAREYAANHTVYLRWIHPARRTRKSILIYVHGWLEPGPWIEETTLFPRLDKEIGVDLAHVQLPFHGKRKPRGSLFHGEFFWSADLVRTMESVRQSVMDVRSAILFFREQGYEQIGVSGISLGGSITMITACGAPLPDYVVPIVAHLDLADAVENAPILWRMKSDLEKFGIEEKERRALFERTGIPKMKPTLPADKQLWIAARDDMYIAAASVERQWEAWGKPRIVWIGGGHMTFPVALDTIVSSMADFRRGLPGSPRSSRSAPPPR